MIRTKLETLTFSWMGFAIVSAIASLFTTGIGLFAIVGALVSGAIGVMLSVWIGRRLLARSSVMRIAMIVVAVIGLALGAVGLVAGALSIFGYLSVALLVQLAVGVVVISLNLRTLRVLTSRDVSEWFAR